MNQLILNSIANSLVLSPHCSRALNLIMDRFEANNVLIYSHGFLYSVQTVQCIVLFWYSLEDLKIILF